MTYSTGNEGRIYEPKNQSLALPGLLNIVGDREAVSQGIFLLSGGAGVGKTMYCRQFLLDGLQNSESCIYISSSLDKIQFEKLFSNLDPGLKNNLMFVNPYSDAMAEPMSEEALGDLLTKSLRQIQDAIQKEKTGAAPASEKTNNSKIQLRVAVDSITYLMLLFGERQVMRFITALSLILRRHAASAVFTIATSDQSVSDTISSLVDGVIEMKLEEHEGSVVRTMRLLSIKGVPHTPKWVKFTISNDGKWAFGDIDDIPGKNAELLTCNLCGKQIAIGGAPLMEGDLVFDSTQCRETHRRFAALYGSNISQLGLPAGVVNISFFFVDIVGLSDPSLSVNRQIGKIESLNKLIDSCEAYKKTPKEKKITFPTGDGMAIGFLLNPELPLQLAIQLHRRLGTRNSGKAANDRIAVRIGLSSGPVFVVKDINDNDNVWGPGIIMARRVMDAGDAGHILVVDKTAEELIALKDEYKAYLRLVDSSFEIKHGQTIKVYSASSYDFGNPEIPEKMR